MSLLQANLAGLGGSGAPGGSLGGAGAVFSHTIGQSLRINTADSAYLSRTSVSGGSTNTMTFSSWVKRVAPGVYHLLWYGKGSNYDAIWIGQDDQIQVIINSTSSGYPQWPFKLRDVSAWFNIVVKIKLDEPSVTNRVKLYINGVDQGLASNGLTAYPPSTATFAGWLGNSNVSYIGFDSGSTYGGGMMADVNVLDGVATGPDSFAETVGGVWVPKNTSGLTFGANGFRLEFANKGTATTSEGTTATQNIGDDSSGQGHNFAVTQIEAHDVLPDSPTNNFATANPLAINKSSPWTTSEGNLKILSSSNNKNIRGTILMQSGKWYWETRRHNANPGSAAISDGVGIALASGNVEDNPYQSATNWTYYSNTGNKYNNNSSQSYGDSWNTAGDIIGVAFDADNGAIWFSKNGTWQNSATASEIAAGTTTNAAYTGLTDAEGYVCNWWRTGGTNAEEMDINFGQNPSFNAELTGGDVGTESGDGSALFKYAPPTGFKALTTSNMPDITIGPGQDTQADDHFDTMLYTGNGAEQHIGAGGVQHPIDTITIANSLRFNDGDTPRLSKTWGRAATDDTTWTVSMWVKRSSQDSGNFHTLFSEESEAWTVCAFYNDTLYIQINAGGAAHYIQTNREYKNFSTWYHIVVAFDEDNSTAAYRLRLYVNGEEETSFATDQRSSISSSSNSNWNTNGKACAIGARSGTNNSLNFDGYMADFHNIDGQQLTPSSFGQVGANGYWIPKAYSGSYGNNGFRLTFQNSSYLGYDYQTSGRSGTTNDWTVAGLTASDQVIDSPTQNFATIDTNTYGVISGSAATSQGNTEVTVAGFSSSVWGGGFSTFEVPYGFKAYVEIRSNTSGSSWGAGVCLKDSTPGSSNSGGAGSVTYYNRAIYKNGTQFQYHSNDGLGGNGDGSNPLAAGNIFSIAVDGTTGDVWFANNGTYFKPITLNNTAGAIGSSAGDPAAGTGSTGTVERIKDIKEPLQIVLFGGSSVLQANFGANPDFNDATFTAGTESDDNSVGLFKYNPPTGFLALMNDNLPQEGIESPDWVWIKGRSLATVHSLHDTLRGTQLLQANAGDAQQDNSNYLLDYGNQGFTVGDNNNVNKDGSTYVAWTWKAGGISPTQTYTVKVVSDGGNKYRFDDFGTSAVTLSLQEGGTYTFDQSDSSNSGHPLRFSTTSNGTHAGGSEYTVGVTTSGTPGTTGAKTVITVAHGAPTLYYYCTQHSGMGGQANTTETHGSSNFKGATQSIVSVNQSAGFSIVRYTGTGSATNIGHGLGAAPHFYTVKNITDDSTSWQSYHRGIASDAETDYIYLNDSAAAGDSDDWSDTAPTADVFYVNSHNQVNENTDSYLAYLFTSIEGYSKFGSYKGNFNAQGPFIYTGFRPAWLMLKRTDSADSWLMRDSKRDPFNVTAQMINANADGAEYTDSTLIDFLSNGFKLKHQNSLMNANGGNFIYLAFAEAPFKFANAR